MGLILNERIDTLALARKETFRDVGAAGESDGIKALRSASPELVRRTVIEAASAWPELADAVVVVSTCPPRVLIRCPYGLHADRWDAIGDVRRDTLVNLREDAAKLAEQAALAVRSARAAECQECKRWGGPPRSGAACDTCGRAVLTADNFAEIEPVLASPDAYATAPGSPPPP